MTILIIAAVLIACIVVMALALVRASDNPAPRPPVYRDEEYEWRDGTDD